MTIEQQQIAALQAKVAELTARLEAKADKPPEVKTAVKPLLGQGPRPHGEATGAHYTGPPTQPQGSSAGGSAGWNFNPYRTLSTGERVYAPDGVPRNEFGEALPMGNRTQAEPVPLPARSHNLDSQVQLLDRLMAQDEARERTQALVAEALAQRALEE